MQYKDKSIYYSETLKKFYMIHGQIEFNKNRIKTLKWHQKVRFIIYVVSSHYKHKFINLYIRIRNRYTMKVLKMILFK
jgi:hypothetical protein